MDYGIQTVIAPSYADIFLSNAYKNGLLPVVLPESVIDKLFQNTLTGKRYTLTVDLNDQTITDKQQNTFSFDIDAGIKNRLLRGLDEIGMTLAHADAIREYEKQRAKNAPWLFPEKR